MQGRVGHHHAAHGHRFQLGHRRQGTRPSHLYINTVDHSLGFLRREFMSDGPAGRPADKTQPFLPIDTINLVNHAVDVVVEPGPRLGNLVVYRHQRIQIATLRGIGIDGKPPPF